METMRQMMQRCAAYWKQCAAWIGSVNERIRTFAARYDEDMAIGTLLGVLLVPLTFGLYVVMRPTLEAFVAWLVPTATVPEMEAAAVALVVLAITGLTTNGFTFVYATATSARRAGILLFGMAFMTSIMNTVMFGGLMGTYPVLYNPDAWLHNSVGAPLALIATRSTLAGMLFFGTLGITQAAMLRASVAFTKRWILSPKARRRAQVPA